MIHGGLNLLVTEMSCAVETGLQERYACSLALIMNIHLLESQ